MYVCRTLARTTPSRTTPTPSLLALPSRPTARTIAATLNWSRDCGLGIMAAKEAPPLSRHLGTLCVSSSAAPGVIVSISHARAISSEGGKTYTTPYLVRRSAPAQQPHTFFLPLWRHGRLGDVLWACACKVDSVGAMHSVCTLRRVRPSF
jgi:hypothetical protein